MKINKKISENWEIEVNKIANNFGIDSVLIMESLDTEMKVLVANESQSHYKENAKGPKSNYHRGCPELYCERIIKTGKSLHVQDASQENEWAKNEDLKLFGLGNYFGVPVKVREKIFGTVCALHTDDFDYFSGNPSAEQEIRNLQKMVEKDLEIILLEKK